MHDFSYLKPIDVAKPAVFLDLCGVIADTYFTRPQGIERLNVGTTYVKTGPYCMGDRIHVPTWKYLRDLFSHYDVQVVVVSSWLRPYLSKDHADVVKLRSFLEFEGIVGSIYTGGGYQRGECVKRCIEALELTTWLVVDDAREQMYLDTAYFNDRRFIHPHGRYGLGAKELEKIDYLLSGKTDAFLENLFQLEDLKMGNTHTVRKTEYTEVVKLVQPGPGGASHQYHVVSEAGDRLANISFQNGPILAAGVNGIQLEDLMAICIDRLSDFQAGPFACEPKQVALEHLRQALNALDARTADRKARNVEGKLEQ